MHMGICVLRITVYAYTIKFPDYFLYVKKQKLLEEQSLTAAVSTNNSS